MEFTFTRFESELLTKLLDGDSSVLECLRWQCWNAQVSRKFTGVGFYLDFVVPEACQQIERGKFRISDVHAEIEGLQFGADSILWIEDGRLTQLEVCSYEEPWPTTINAFELSYTSENRNFPFENQSDRTKR
jgi:hypothetical protein